MEEVSEREEKRERKKENKLRGRETVLLLPPVSQLGSVQLQGVLEKEDIICKASSSVHTWTCFQHLSPVLSV